MIFTADCIFPVPLLTKNLSCAQEKMKELFETCLFEPGYQVLALLSVAGSPFQTKFSGPYTVKKQTKHKSDRDYLVYTVK